VENWSPSRLWKSFHHLIIIIIILCSLCILGRVLSCR